MSFQQDVAATRGLGSGALQRGMRALPRGRGVSLRAGRTATGSVDVDAALASVFPNDPRWDAVVALAAPDGEELHWVEVHPADTRARVAEVAAKARWLTAWLAGDGRLLCLTRYPVSKRHWVASGRSGFRRNARQLRLLASLGVEFAGSHLTLR